MKDTYSKAFHFMLYFFVLLNWGCNTNGQQANSFDENNPINYIKTEKPGSGILVVKLGTDAITAINTGNGIIVIDAGISYSLTKYYRKIVEKEFGSNHFSYLINTHSHIDHTGGNAVFYDAKLIGQINGIKDIENQEKRRQHSADALLKTIDGYKSDLHALDKGSADWEEAFVQCLRYQFAYSDLKYGRKVIPPSITFQDSLSVLCGNVRIDMVYFGKAHSESDIFIHIPAYKVLMTGDLIFKGGRASLEKMEEKDKYCWRKAKSWITNRLDSIETIVTGHGQFLEKKDLYIFLTQVEEQSNNLLKLD